MLKHSIVLMAGGGHIGELLLHFLCGKAVGGSFGGDGGLGISSLSGKTIDDLIDEGDGVDFMETKQVSGD